MRHSEALKYNNVNNSDSLQIQNENGPQLDQIILEWMRRGYIK